MIITFECECGNKLTISTLPKKYVQLRDCLELKQFHYDGMKLQEGDVKELQISCDKCRNWVVLGID